MTFVAGLLMLPRNRFIEIEQPKSRLKSVSQVCNIQEKNVATATPDTLTLDLTRPPSLLEKVSSSIALKLPALAGGLPDSLFF